MKNENVKEKMSELERLKEECRGYKEICNILSGILYLTLKEQGKAVINKRELSSVIGKKDITIDLDDENYYLLWDKES